MRVARNLVAIALTGVFGVPTALAQTINVPANQPTIQAAINAAVNGDVVLVAPGTYNERPDLLGKSLTLQGTGGAGQTVIDGQNGGTVIRTSSAASFAIRGFTVRGGTSLSTLLVGGIESIGATNGLIEHNAFTGNVACFGSAAYLTGGVTFRNNIVWGNRNDCSGGGAIGTISAGAGSQVSGNLIVNNIGSSGGGVATGGNATVSGNVIARNSGNPGAGIYVDDGPARIVNNLVLRNGGFSLLAGIAIGHQAPGQQIVGNTVVMDGGSGFQVDTRLGAPGTVVRSNVFQVSSDTPIRCFSSSGIPEIAPPAFTANDFVGPGPRIGPGSTCSDPVGADGNLAVTPGFVDEAHGDYHLVTTSALVDAGTALDAPTTDGDSDTRPLDGNPASLGAQVDIGWDEVGDLTSLETTLTGGPSGTVGGGSQPAFVFSSQTAGATFECDVDMRGFSACTSPLSLTVQDTRVHTFRVRARAAGGLIDRTPAMRIFEVDTTAPNTLVDASPFAVATGWRAVFHSDDPVAVFECSLDSAPFATCESPYDFLPTVGAHTLRVRAVDAIGNIDASPLVLPFVVPPPDTFLTQPTPVFNTGNWSATITSNVAGVTFECSLDAAPFTPCSNPIELVVPLGAHTLAARAVSGSDVDLTPASVVWTSTCTLFGSPGIDTVFGTFGNDRLCGLAGDDTIMGFAGDDFLSGGSGDDVLDGGPGADSLNGNDGFDDVADYSDRTTPVKVVLGDGLPDGGVEDGAGDTIGVLVEDIWGGSGNDQLTGDFDDNVIDGGLGADVIQGGLGFDFADYSLATTPVTADLDGQFGDDGRAGEGDSLGLDVESILGGAAGDTLTGGLGEDLIAGGVGNDTITGGPATDSLFGEDGNDTIVAADGAVDDVDCGPGVDTAYIDVGESVFNCETTVFGAPPVLSATPPPILSTSRVSPVHLLRITGASGTSKAGMLVQLACDSNQQTVCNVRLAAKTTVLVKGAKRTFTVGQLTAQLRPGQPSSLSIRLNARAATLFKTRTKLTVRVESALASPSGAFVAGPKRTVIVKRSKSALKSRLVFVRRLHTLGVR